MIDNMLGLSYAFTHLRAHKHPAAEITALALRLVRTDMGHPTALRYLPEAYHGIVSEAREWLREANEVIAGERERTWDSAPPVTMNVDNPGPHGYLAVT